MFAYKVTSCRLIVVVLVSRGCGRDVLECGASVMSHQEKQGECIDELWKGLTK